MTNRSRQVSFAASSELYDAIEILAYSNNDTIANTIRQIVSKEMIEYGIFDPRAATTEQNAANNARFLPKSERRVLRAEATA